MPKYTASIFCSDCWELHTIAEHLEIENGPERFGQLQETLSEARTPAKLETVLHQPVICPKSRKEIVDPERVYLVRQPGSGGTF
jgi:hypothetical protein